MFPPRRCVASPAVRKWHLEPPLVSRYASREKTGLMKTRRHPRDRTLDVRIEPDAVRREHVDRLGATRPACFLDAEPAQWTGAARDEDTGTLNGAPSHVRRRGAGPTVRNGPIRRSEGPEREGGATVRVRPVLMRLPWGRRPPRNRNPRLYKSSTRSGGRKMVACVPSPGADSSSRRPSNMSRRLRTL